MAHSNPTNITTKGDAARMTAAMGAWIVCLVSDARMEALYPDWLLARQIMQRAIPTVSVDAGVQIVLQHKAVELAVTEQHLRDQLRLPATWAAWTTPALLSAWEHRANDLPFAVPVTIAKSAPKGKRPWKNGDDIARNVEWLYRTWIKVPPASVRLLATEYAGTTNPNRRTDARSVVQNGIKQARALLEIVTPDRLRTK